MKLALVLFDYFPYGGLQRDMLSVARACVAAGHEVTVLTRSWEGERESGVNVLRLPVSGHANHVRDRRFADAVREHLEKRCDRSLAFNKLPGADFYYAADGCLAADIPARSPKRLLPRYRQRLAMEAAVFSPQASTRILSISPPQKALYLKHHGLDADRFIDLPPPVRPDRALPADYPERRSTLRRQWGLTDRDQVLLFVGSGFRTKGLDRALAALARLRRDGKSTPRLWVAGQGKVAPFARMARRLGVADSVSFLGGRDDVPALMHAADVLVHPAYRENTGTVLLEAMLNALPVAASGACGFAPYLLDFDMGRVLPEPFGKEALALALKALLDMPLEQRLAGARRALDEGDFFSMPDRVVHTLEADA